MVILTIFIEVVDILLKFVAFLTSVYSNHLQRAVLCRTTTSKPKQTVSVDDLVFQLKTLREQKNTETFVKLNVQLGVCTGRPKTFAQPHSCCGR